MKSDFTMPSLGADMDSGTLVEWLVAPGDRVARGDIVAVVETQKGAIDIEIHQSGVIDELLGVVGEAAPVGALLARLTLDPGQEPVVAAVPPAAAAPVEAPGTPTVSAAAPSPSPGRVQASPRARRQAQALGVDLAAVSGSGPDGAITFEDVERAGAASEPAFGDPMRAAIAAAMTRSNRDIPQYQLAHCIDLERALSWLEDGNRSRSIRDRILPIALLVRAVATALRKYPQLAGWVRNDRFEAATEIDVGIATATRQGGLINPMVATADTGSLESLWAKIRDVTERARKGGLRAAELSGGCVTVSSLGDRGVQTVYGVIHPPQVAIIGFGAVAPRALVVDGKVAVRRAVDMTLAADHRITDGHLGARFVHHVAAVLGEPEAL